jgi:hypothetical protein
LKAGLAFPIQMNRIYSWTISTLVVITCACAVAAQSNNSFEIAKVVATLQTTVDTQTSARDDGFTLVTMNDVAVGGAIIIPKGSKIFGHVAGATNKGKDASKSVLGLSIDRAVTANGDVPLQAIIVALAAPKKSESDSSVATSTSVSNQPKTPPRTVINSGDVSLLLTDNDQGTFGFEDVSISWHLSIPPPLTILATRNKRLRIEAGSQMLLRMMPPKAVN